jgi:hypothetical protein
MITAWLLFSITFLLPFLFRDFRNNTRIILAYWFVLFLHQVVALTNAFLFLTPGATGDAEAFHLTGLVVAQTENFKFMNGAEGFYSVVGAIYWLFGINKLTGQEFTVLMFASSCIVLVKILRLIGLYDNSVSILIVFGALPSMVFFGSVTLRESYAILFFMLTFHFGMKLHLKKGGRINYIFIVASAYFMGILHPALMAYALCLICLLFIWTPYSSSSWEKIRIKRLFVALGVLVLFIGVDYLSRTGLVYIGVFDEMRDAKLLDLIHDFRLAFESERQMAARANYQVILDFSTLFSTVDSFLQIYVSYLFKPFLWQAKSLTDIFGSLEGIFRMVLIYCSVKHWLNTYGLQRRMFGLMLVLFISMSFMWSIGTSNYGTAARHNMLSWWLLAITGTPFLLRSLRRFRL